MPKQPSRKRAASDEYEADCGFVEDAPKSKRPKASASASESKSKTATKSKDSDEVFWELGGKRRIQVSEFKGAQLVNIREFYEKDDQMLPGKKGISLNIEQFEAFVEQLPEIEQALEAKGVSIPRPAYGARTSAKDNDDDDEVEEEPQKKLDAADSEDDKEPMPVKAGRLDKYKMKANHEATSDEDN